MEKEKKLKWNGWGYEGEEFPPERAKKIIEMLSGFLGVSEEDYSPSRKLGEVEIKPSEVDLDSLKKNLGNSHATAEKYDRVLHSSGRSYKNLVRLRKGKVRNSPDAVVYIKDKEDILRVFEWCYENDTACVPFGGGTSVVGGVDTYDIEKPVISVDLTHLNKVLWVDKKSKTARVQAGIRGPHLEDELRKHGVALRHYPQSFHFSTLGGWIATRSAGHFSSRYGKIEDMVEVLEVITPRGTFENIDVPSSACGPETHRFFIGSEGILGIISEAVVRCHSIPDRKFSTSFVFPDFETASEVARKIIQTGIFPPLMRILDEREFMISSLLAGGKFQGGSLFILGFEADDETEKLVKMEFDKSREIALKFGGKDEGVKKLEEWKKEYFEQPYLRDVLMDFSLVVDTLETATTWSGLMNLYKKVKESMEGVIFSETIGGVSCRITHVYSSGASLYFSFFAKARRDEEEVLWWKIKKAASDAISENGGTISHHHGVGRDHKPWAQKELGRALNIISSMKKEVDPKSLLNPGVIL